MLVVWSKVSKVGYEERELGLLDCNSKRISGARARAPAVPRYRVENRSSGLPLWGLLGPGVAWWLCGRYTVQYTMQQAWLGA